MLTKIERIHLFQSTHSPLWYNVTFKIIEYTFSRRIRRQNIGNRVVEKATSLQEVSRSAHTQIHTDICLSVETMQTMSER